MFIIKANINNEYIWIKWKIYILVVGLWVIQIHFLHSFNKKRKNNSLKWHDHIIQEPISFLIFHGFVKMTACMLRQFELWTSNLTSLPQWIHCILIFLKFCVNSNANCFATFINVKRTHGWKDSHNQRETEKAQNLVCRVYQKIIRLFKELCF